jgi:hypothetical protein
MHGTGTLIYFLTLKKYGIYGKKFFFCLEPDTCPDPDVDGYQIKVSPDPRAW